MTGDGTLPRVPTGARRILVRCPNWLGDTVMALPALRALRAALPAADVWCVGPWIPALLEAEPGIGRCLGLPRSWRARAALARRLRGAAIDLAVLLATSFESALFAWLAGARWRLGYTGDGRAALLTHRVGPDRDPVHQVDAYLGLLAPLGIAAAHGPAPVLAIAPARRQEARRLLAGAGVQGGEPVVGLSLGAAYGPSKLWPAERLAELAVRLGAAGRCPVFLGDASAEPLLERVRAILTRPWPSLVGRDHPALLPALLGECRVVVAADSGAAHVAAAVGVPVVTLFGPTDPRLTAPRGAMQAALWRKPACAPCFQRRCPIDHRCLRDITVDAVLEAVTRGLGTEP